MEVKANEVFTKLTKKNNFKPDALTSTADAFEEINRRLQKMKAPRSTGR